MTETLITWEEAEWTRQALGLSVADFARLLGVTPATVYQRRGKAHAFLSDSSAALLTLAVNRIDTAPERMQATGRVA
jgi:DNA-binding transcriptional regulator YiaG